MPALANSSTAWRSWWDQLHKLSKADDISTTELKQFIDDPPLKSELTRIAAEDMTPTDVNESFCLTQVHGPEAWQFPRPLIHLRPDFEKCTEARSRCKIYGLLLMICENLKARGFLEDGLDIGLQFETALECEPVTYHNRLHKCVGTADYKAKQDYRATNSHGQLLAYMAMVRAMRKARGQPDSTVWGALTDGQWFYFFRLNNGGQWSCVAYECEGMRLRRLLFVQVSPLPLPGPQESPPSTSLDERMFAAGH
ncbi:hypothetical protein N7519_007412 [Penicillium mononematosum]|uniref:uncharacterized protein n=1 Tax=Penicillium mononematosum TaxID=268346 RepID=UPI002546F04C|nr:uncharacterized protein N7519_007412 [Penicillium mononematosum]KAJ6186111.1 hypothetical protein N7519_007412 [Penicillium mononematosum]